MCEFIHGIFTEGAMVTCVLIWISVLMETEVKGTGTRDRGPERWPGQGSGSKEEWYVGELGGRLRDPVQGGN